MGFYDIFTKEDLVDLLTAYDSYITAACESKILDSGWRPVGITEFYQHEFQNVWDPQKGAESFDYMFEGVDMEPSIPEKGSYFIDGAHIFKENDQLMCQFPGGRDAVPLRSRIQDIQEGDAFLVESGISGHLVRQASDAAHQNFDEPDCPWIVYDAAGCCWFEEDIANAPRALLAMEYGKDQSNSKDLRTVSFVTIVRERPSENEQWADSFWVDAKTVPTIDLFRNAVQSYLGTGDGLRDIKMTSEDFNWGDAMMHMPEFYWNTFGIYKVDPTQSPAEKGLSPTANYNPVTFVVDQDEVLIPDSYYETRNSSKNHRPLEELLKSAEKRPKTPATKSPSKEDRDL